MQIILRTLSIATHYAMFNTTVIDGRRFSELYKYYFININYLTFNSLHVGSLNIGLHGTISLCGKPNNRLVSGTHCLPRSKQA